MQQVLPFGAIVLVLFAFALDPDRGLLSRVAPGLFWTAVLLAALLAVGRAFAVEEGNAARDGLRLSGLDGIAIFFGKAMAIVVELAVLEVVLGVGVVVLYDVEVHGLLLDRRRGHPRDHRARSHRYRLRRARSGGACPRDARPAARAAGGHAGDARRDASVRRRARRSPG